MPAPVGVVPAAPEQADDLECFPQHVVPGVDRIGKPAADDVLVEPLTGAHTEGEPVLGDECEGGQRPGR